MSVKHPGCVALLRNMVCSAQWHKAHCHDSECNVNLFMLYQMAEDYAEEFLGGSDVAESLRLLEEMPKS